MPDPVITPVEPVAGSVAGGNSGQTLAQVIAEAVVAGVQSALSQSAATQEWQKQAISDVTDAVKSIQSDIANMKTEISKSTESDVDSETVVRSAVDPEDSHRYSNLYRDLAAGNAISFSKAVDKLIIRQLSVDTDHHSALPPVAPRSASGPGTTAS